MDRIAVLTHFRQQVDSLQVILVIETQQVSQSAKDISTLQQNLEEKDKISNR
jgi:hypothetical protein